MSIAADNMVQAYRQLIATLSNNCVPLPREIVLDLKAFMLMVEGNGGAHYQPVIHDVNGWAVSCNFPSGRVLFRLDPDAVPPK